MKTDLIMQQLAAKHPGEPEFLQAVREVLHSIEDVYNQHPEFERAKIIERLVEPDRILTFRVPWTDDKGEIHVNIGYRVQFNNAIGPYKGGIRFHPSVNLSILKFLGFEQTFKNALTTLPMGGAKGGSDFAPRGKSDAEIMRFCQSFMLELWRNVGPDQDVPAGDIGTGAREIGYMYGQYRRIKGSYKSVLTGKGLAFGGSLARTQATGFGLCYFTDEMLRANGKSFKDATVVVSGSGNVALYTTEKLIQLGAKPVTLSDSNGSIYDPEGITQEKLEWIKDLKTVRRGRIREYAEAFKGVQYMEGQRPWNVPCDCAYPSATQNEINGEDAANLVKNGCKLVCEGANMPSTPEAIETYKANGVAYAPGKASNAGGVATSGLEMSQNSGRMSWDAKTVDDKLHGIMVTIHDNCRKTAEEYGMPGNYQAGANICSFLKIANSMLDQGVF